MLIHEDRSSPAPVTSADRWFAVRVKSNREYVCAAALNGRGYEVFLPHQSRSGRTTQQAMLPLFPGYLFCRFDSERRLPVLTVPGIVHIVGIGRVPSPVDDGEIEALRIVVKTGLPLNTEQPYTVDEKVHIARGPLGGLTGIVSQVRSDNAFDATVIVSITLLRRSIAVAVPGTWLEHTTPEHEKAARHYS